MEEKNPKVIPFQKQRRDRRAVVLFLCLLAVLVLALTFFAVDNGRNWDSVRRFFAFGEESLRIERGVSGIGAQLDGNLVTAGGDGVILYDADGKTVFVAMAELSAPQLQTTHKRILAYDAGGSQMLLLNEKGDVLLENGDMETIYDADLSEDGSVACLTAGTREKAVLRVYDQSQLLSYTLKSDTRYLSRCAISPRGERVCAVALGQEEGGFRSAAVVYETDQQEPVAQVDLGSQMIYDVKFWDSSTICLVGETELTVINAQGKVLGSYTYGELLDYDLGGDGFCALLVSSEKGTELVTLGKKGQVLGSMAAPEAGMEIAAKDGYVAWISGGTLTIGGPKLKTYSTISVPGAENEICLGELGVVYLMDNRGASRYLP